MTEPARTQPAPSTPARVDPPLVHEPGAARDQVAYLKLRSQILVDAPRVRAIGVVSAHQEKSRTNAALQLARTLGQGRRRSVLLIDGDFKRAGLTHRVERHRKGEAKEVAENPYRLFRNVAEGVDLLAPPAPPRAQRAHDPVGWRETLDALVPKYDYVVVDCPPVLDQPDAFVVRDALDALVVVAVAGRTKVADLARVIDGRAEHILAVLLRG